MDQTALRHITDFLKLSKMQKTLKVLAEESEEKKPYRVSIKEIVQFNGCLKRKVRQLQI